MRERLNLHFFAKSSERFNDRPSQADLSFPPKFNEKSHLFLLLLFSRGMLLTSITIFILILSVSFNLLICLHAYI